MKITKTSACVLPVTFLIGFASVPPERAKQIVPEIPLNISPEMPGNVSRVSPAPAAENKLVKKVADFRTTGC